MASVARWGGLRPDPYDPDAKDADGDGIVQEGTAFERPAGMRIVDEFGRDLLAGITSDTRSSNWRVVDKSGNTVNYVPTYQRTPSQPIANFAGTVGGRVGTVRDRVGTIGDRLSTLDKVAGTIVSLPDLEEARAPGQVSDETRASWSAARELSLQRRRDAMRRLVERLEAQGSQVSIEPLDTLMQLMSSDDDDIANDARQRLAVQFYEHRGIGEQGRFYSRVADARWKSVTDANGEIRYVPEIRISFHDSSAPYRYVGSGFVTIGEFAPDQIEHDLIEFEPEYRGLGIAQEFLTATEMRYAAAGVGSIHGFASLDSGPYMWARDGFDWDTPVSKDIYLDRLESNVSDAERDGTLTKQIADEYRKLIMQAYRQSATYPDRLMPLHFSFMPKYAELATNYYPLDFRMRRNVRQIRVSPNPVASYNLPTIEGQMLPEEMLQPPDMGKVSELIAAADSANQLVPRAIASAFYQNDFSWIVDQFAFDASGYASMGGDAIPVEGLTLSDIAQVMSIYREDAQASARRVADENGMVRVFRAGSIRHTDEPVSVSLDRSDAEQFGDVYEYLVPVEAFEYEPPAGSSYGGEFLVNPNMMSLVNKETVTVNEETETGQQDENEQSLVLPLLRVKNKRPRTSKTLAEIPTSPGKLAVPRSVQDSPIVDEASAIEAFNNGTELADIPSHFMHAAISANAELEDGDPRKRFKQVPKNGGRMKNVQIYSEVDASGETTNNGFVFAVVGPPEGLGMQHSLKEVALQQILVSLGINTSPATIDGAFVDSLGRTQDSFYAVFPHAFNEAPAGEQVHPDIPEEFRFKGNMDVQSMQMLLPDKGVRERLANFVVSYGLALEDRHPGNTMGGVFRDSDGTLRPHVVPIDLDIRGWDTDVNLNDYMRDFRMDLLLVDDIKKVLSIMPDTDSTQEPLSEQEKEQLRRDLIEIWSQITERFQQLAADADEVIESIVLNGRVAQHRTAYGWDEEKTMERMVEVDEMSEFMYDYIRRGASRLSKNQERFFKLIFGA